MTVSVIIPSYNSHKTIEPAIRALVDARHPALREIIIVDSSDDGVTGSWLDEQRSAMLRVIRLDAKTIPALGRNIGARQAAGDVLAFLDADAYPDDGWIDGILKATAEGCRAGGGSVLMPPFQIARPIAWAQYYLQFSDFMPFGSRRAAPFTPSCNLFCERALFLEVGGFPDVRAAEDVLFGLRVRQKTPFYFDPAVRVFHIFREEGAAYFSNQRLLGRYVLRYRRDVSGGVYRGWWAYLTLPPGLVYKWLRIFVRAVQSSRWDYFEAWLKSHILLLKGIYHWAAGYAGEISARPGSAP